MNIDRRQFIKSSCSACIGIAATGFLSSALSSCAPAFPVFKAKFDKGLIQVPVTSFETSNLIIVRDLQMDFDILLVKKSAADYQALYMKCSHQANPLTATSSGLFCSAHGSSFDLDGNVRTEPANGPLQKFKTELNDNIITINFKL
jgi:cytochrome b6-f complex iron-sulfur subunit